VYERKHVAFVFLSLAYFINIMSSNCIHLPSNHMLLFFLWLNKTSLFIGEREREKEREREGGREGEEREIEITFS
jgi:hypothetical protein